MIHLFNLLQKIAISIAFTTGDISIWLLGIAERLDSIIQASIDKIKR